MESDKHVYMRCLTPLVLVVLSLSQTGQNESETGRDILDRARQAVRKNRERLPPFSCRITYRQLDRTIKQSTDTRREVGEGRLRRTVITHERPVLSRRADFWCDRGRTRITVFNADQMEADLLSDGLTWKTLSPGISVEIRPHSLRNNNQEYDPREWPYVAPNQLLSDLLAREPVECAAWPELPAKTLRVCWRELDIPLLEYEVIFDPDLGFLPTRLYYWVDGKLQAVHGAEYAKMLGTESRLVHRYTYWTAFEPFEMARGDLDSLTPERFEINGEYLVENIAPLTAPEKLETLDAPADLPVHDATQTDMSAPEEPIPEPPEVLRDSGPSTVWLLVGMNALVLIGAAYLIYSRIKGDKRILTACH